MSTSPFFLQQYTDQSGKPLSFGSLTFLLGGSSNTPKNIYVDHLLTTVASNPLPLDTIGRSPEYFMEGGFYKVIVKDKLGSIIATRDYIDGTSASGSSPVVLDYKVKTNTFDTAPGFLNDKIESSNTVIVDINDIGGHDYLMSFRVNESALSGSPKGPAGGDLAGTYPDPIVKQLTGLDADMIGITTDFTYNTTPNMTGITYGKSYKNGIESDVWCAISYAGNLRFSYDEWKTTVEDTGLRLLGIGSQWNSIFFTYISSLSSWAWVAGDGTQRCFYVATHDIANYNSDGTIISTAWTTIPYSFMDGIKQSPNNVGDIATGLSATCWVGNTKSIGRTLNFSTFSVPFEANLTLGGIATDNYGNWMVVERASGILYKSTNDGLNWSQVTTINVDGVSATHLPITHSEVWGSINCSFGTWLASVYSGTTGHISYAYSKNGNDWLTITNNNQNFYSAASDGTKWFATNPTPNATQSIFRLLISEIPAHKRLVCEEGLVVTGDTYLTDLPSYTLLGTDTHGKIVSANTSSLITGKVKVSNTDTNQDYLENKLQPYVGIAIDKVGSGNEWLNFSSLGYVCVGSGDTIHQKTLDEKLLAGDGIGFGISNNPPYGNQITISATNSGMVKTYSTDISANYLSNKLIAGAGITITSASDINGTKLVINSKGNSWKLIKYISSNYTVLDTDDTLVIRANANITFPTPSAQYEGRIITVRNAVNYTCSLLGAIVGTTTLGNNQKLELICFNNGSGYFWYQQ